MAVLVGRPHRDSAVGQLEIYSIEVAELRGASHSHRIWCRMPWNLARLCSVSAIHWKRLERQTS